MRPTSLGKPRIQILNYVLLVVLIAAIIWFGSLIGMDRLLKYNSLTLPVYCGRYYVDFPDTTVGGVLQHIPISERIQSCIDDKGVVPPQPSIDPLAPL